MWKLFIGLKDAHIFQDVKVSKGESILYKARADSSFWYLNVDTEKITIFEKGKTFNKRFYCGNFELELVDTFNYLRVMFYKNGHIL